MTNFKVQLSLPCDTNLPKDAITLNPHFQGTDAQALANAIKTNCIANQHILSKPFTIKVTHLLQPDTDILEYFCAENEKDRLHTATK